MPDDTDEDDPYLLKIKWQRLTLSFRQLVFAEIFSRLGAPDDLQQLPALQLHEYLRSLEGELDLRLRSRHSPAALRRIRQVESIKEEFLRKGASAEIMQWLFRISKRQVQAMRRRLGISNAVTGRPRRLSREQEYEIFAAWERMRDQGKLFPQIMIELSEKYPDTSMASLYAVIKRAI